MKETWDVEERGAGKGGRRGSGAQGGLYVYCSLGCHGGTRIHGEAVKEEPRWRETLQVQGRGSRGSRAPAGRAESDAVVDGGVIGPECAPPSPRLPGGQEGCGGCREIWGWDGGDKKLKEFLPYHLFFSAKWEELKSSCAYLLAHQTLVIFILFKLLIYSFTPYSSSTCYVRGAVLGA